MDNRMGTPADGAYWKLFGGMALLAIAFVVLWLVGWLGHFLPDGRRGFFDG